jgi:hypothetical protein
VDTPDVTTRHLGHPQGPMATAPAPRDRARPPAIPLARRHAPPALLNARRLHKAQEVIARIEAESRSFHDRRNLPVLRELAQKSPAVKEAVLGHFLETEPAHVDILAVVRHMALGHDEGASALRKRALEHLLDKREFIELATRITDFNPSPQDVPLLLRIGQEIAAHRNGQLPLYVSLLTGTQQHMYAHLVNPRYKPLALARDDKRMLVRTWLAHAPHISMVQTDSRHEHGAFAYQHVEEQLGLADLFMEGTSTIPDFLGELHPHCISPAADAAWLRFSAAHLGGLPFSERESTLLASTFLSLLPHSTAFRHGASQMIGKAMQHPEAGEQLLSTLENFQDKSLGIAFHAATGRDVDLAVRFAAVLNPMTEPEPAIVADVAEFGGSDRIAREDKIRFLREVADAMSSAPDPMAACRDGLRKLGAIGRTINMGSAARLGAAYRWWLPRCENLEQLAQAVEPDRDFISRLLEMQIVAGDPGAIDFLDKLQRPEMLYGDWTIPAGVTEFLPHEILSMVRNAIGSWVETHDMNGLLGRVEYVKQCLVHCHDDEDDYPDDDDDDSALGVLFDHCPVLCAPIEHACAEDDAALYSWAKLAALLMLDCPPAVCSSAFLADMLGAIARFHDGQGRLAPTVCLYLCVREIATAKALEAFSAPLKPGHPKVFAAPLFVLADNGGRASELTGLLALVQNHRFRDTKKAVPLLKYFSEMALISVLAPDEKWRIMDVVSAEAVEAKAVTPAMMYLLGLAELAEARADRDDALTALRNIREVADVEKAGKLLLQVLFSVPEGEVDAFAEKFNAYLHASRSPAALLSYATSIFLGMRNQGKRDQVMQEIGLLARGLVANDGGATLASIRYDTKDNAHNARLQEKAPAAWACWKEEVQYTDAIVYNEEDLEVEVDAKRYLKERIVDDKHVPPGTFPLLARVLEGEMQADDALGRLEDHVASEYKDVERTLLLAVMPGKSHRERADCLKDLSFDGCFEQLASDIAGLKKKLEAPPLSLAKCREMIVSISAKPEDLFLIGTEVIGSCQSIYGEPEWNKALPGYVLDGKYLSAQVANKHGTQWRRMLRLVLDENDMPVIFVEREYSNPGVPKKARDACLALIRQKAAQMGARIATLDEDLADKAAGKIGTLLAYRSPRPNEYVDAVQGMKHFGGYHITGAYPMKAAASM